MTDFWLRGGTRVEEITFSQPWVFNGLTVCGGAFVDSCCTNLIAKVLPEAID